MTALNLGLVFFLVLVLLNYRAQRSVLYPPFIFSVMWFVDLAIYRSGLIEVDPLHSNTLAIVAFGAASFSAGGFLAGFMPRPLLRMHLFRPNPERMPYLLRNTLMIVLLCGLPVMFYHILQLSASQGGGFNVLAQAHEAMVEAAQNEKSAQSFALDNFMKVCIYVPLLFAVEKRDRQFWVVCFVALVASILTTGRGSLLLLLSGLSAIRLLQTKQESLKSAMRFLRWPIALFSILYVVLIFTNKDVEGMTGGVVGIASYFVFGYIVGPLAAFDRVVQHPVDFMGASNHTFKFFLRLAAGLHLMNFSPPPFLDKFVFVPFPTNVYTVFKFYFLELHITGIVVLFFLFGLVHSLLYLKVRQGGRFSVYLFSFSIYSVLMVIFDDTYSDIGGYLRAIAFGLLYFAIGSIPLRLLPTVKPERLSGHTLTS